MRCARRAAATPFGRVSFLRAGGPAGARAGLLAHGLGSDGSWFPAQHREHDLGFLPWLVPDLLGHGRSDRPDGDDAYRMAGQARALAELLAAEGVGEVVLVGHSMGGLVALRLAELLAREGRARVVGLVLAEGNLDPGDAFMSRGIAAQDRATFVAAGWPLLLAELAAVPGLAAYRRSLERAGAHVVWASAVDLVRESRPEVTVPLARGVAAPRLFLFGERNRGRYTSEALARELGEVAYVPGSGHAPHEDNPPAFWRLVRDFNARL